MEIDELKSAWATLNARAETIEQRQAFSIQQDALHQAKSRLRLLGARLIAQIVIGAGFALFGGSYWFDHWSEMHLVLAGMAVHGYGILLVVLALAQVVAWRSIDYGQPVFVVQSKVARLRILRARAERALLVAAAVLWVPLGLMLLNAAGLDVWTYKPALVWANLAVGLSMGAALIWAMKRWPDAFERFAIGGGIQEAEDVLGSCNLHK